MRIIKLAAVICMMLQVLCLPRAMAAVSQPYMEYLSAWASLAVYNDKLGLLAREVLSEYGWQTRFVTEQTDRSDVKVLLAQKQEADQPIYLAAISGTASAQDIKTDLRTGSAVFGGSTPEQFSAFMKDGELTDDKPLVHRGFCQYVQDGFFLRRYDEKNGLTLGETMAELLQSDQKAKLYITGHSLGGAAAELLVARLSDMGVPSSQMQTITFGAPAVGNQCFVDAYEDKLNLTRVTMQGDPVKNLAQIANDRFVQFKTAEQWTLPYSEADKFAHGMLLYFDRAMCRYYSQAQVAAEIENSDIPISVSFDFPPELAETEKYIELAVKDNFRHKNISLDPGRSIAYRFQAEQIREDTSNKRYYINSVKYIRATDGKLISYSSAAADTKEMTVAQAALYAAYQCDK